MLFIHDIHAVIGEHEFEFEDEVRYEYAPAVAKDDARLLWYLHATHGAGEAYKIVTLTAVRDGAAWQRLVDRLRTGDLAAWRERVDAMRYGSTSTLLVQMPWSPLGDVDLEASSAASESEHDVTVYREDTLEGPGVLNSVGLVDPDRDGGVLRCVAAFRPMLSVNSELRILYRVAPPEIWGPAFGADTGWDDWTGSLAPTLPEGVRCSRRMLRTTSWSPIA